MLNLIQKDHVVKPLFFLRNGLCACLGFGIPRGKYMDSLEEVKGALILKQKVYGWGGALQRGQINCYIDSFILGCRL